jgi:hypothetical protein
MRLNRGAGDPVSEFVIGHGILKKERIYHREHRGHREREEEAT